MANLKLPSLNRVMVAGRITRDITLKHTPSGTAIAELSVACERRFKGKDGNPDRETTFVDVQSWGATAENIAKYAGKGTAVLVEGRLKQDTWDDKTTGQKRSKMLVVADSISALEWTEKEAVAADAVSPATQDDIPF